MTRHFSKEVTQITIIRKNANQNHNALSPPPGRKAVTNKITSAGEEESLHTVGGNVNYCSLKENGVDVPQNPKIELASDSAIPLKT